MAKNKDEFERITGIMGRHGGTVSSAYPQNRGLTAGGHLVHVIKMEDNPLEKKGIKNSHGPGIAWDYICIESANGGLDPTLYPIQAFYVKEKKNGKYTFRGVYKIDAVNSTEYKITCNRIATEVNEENADWRIVRFV